MSDVKYKNTIVIGSLFGDEGKGVAVNNLCTEDSLVVRFSGGQQAGHTVIHNGIKHIFSSYGAGTLKGCPTFFTEDTTFYLPNIFREKNVLKERGISDPKLFLHPLAIATTPYDIAFNRAMESKNGHGSCGMGVGATMNRTLKTGYKLYAIDFFCRKILEEKLKNIFYYYWNIIKTEFKYNDGPHQIFLQEVDRTEADFYESLDNILPFQIKQLFDIEQNYVNLVFEGSQGVLLDMDHGVFPNVTYANTTSKNALKYCDMYNTEIYYTARSYLTRHGNGWFPNSCEPLLINNEEEINVSNQYQGNFRRAEFDYDLLNYAISLDSIYSEDIPKNLIIGCVDQIPDFKLDESRVNGVNYFYENHGAESNKLYSTKDLPF